MICKIIISPQGLSIVSFDGGKWKINLYTFDGERLKSDLFLNVLGIHLHVENGSSFELDNFAIEKDTKEILDFFAMINLTEEEKLKTLVEQHLHGDMNREQFEHEIVPYRVAEKLSK